jgi:hypothetical protein
MTIVRSERSSNWKSKKLAAATEGGQLIPIQELPI